jgi:uncharacterized linocin/CFP29 family protein
VNHLLRDLAPISESAWSEIDEEATRQLTHFMAARKLVDFVGPLGWAHSAVSLGRAESRPDSPYDGVTAAQRKVLPMLELRSTFTVERSELEAVDRGASDVDLEPLAEACRTLATAEDRLVFAGYEGAGITGIGEASPHDAVLLDTEFNSYPNHVAKAVATLKGAGVAGPYAIALGPRCYTGVIETTEDGGYPLFRHLQQILGGPVVWAPGVDGAVVVSQRGGDYELVIGKDFSIGYSSYTADAVQLYLEESLTLVVVDDRAAVRLGYPG